MSGRQDPFVVSYCPNQLGLPDGQEKIDGHSNPAAVLFELLTTPAIENPAPGQRSGYGVAVEDIDVESFRKVGAALAATGRGFSMLLASPVSLDELRTYVLQRINGRLSSTSAGLVTLTLGGDIV